MKYILILSLTLFACSEQKIKYYPGQNCRLLSQVVEIVGVSSFDRYYVSLRGHDFIVDHKDLDDCRY